jgi:hypothetical protein
MVNNKPAARLGDSTAHGGKIVVGCPTVLIGGGGGGGGSSASASGGAINTQVKAGPGVGDAPDMNALANAIPNATPTATPNALAQSLSEAAKDGTPFTESPFCDVCNK